MPILRWLLLVAVCLSFVSWVRAEDRPRVGLVILAEPALRAELEREVTASGALPVEFRLLPAPSALARAPGEDAQTSLAGARERYVAADFEGCLAQLADDADIVRTLAAGDVALAARTLVWRTACQAGRGATAEAARSADTLARFGLELPPDVGVVSPDVELMLTDAVRRARNAPRVSARIESDPPGLELAVDGRARACLTPCTVEWSLGEHVVEVHGAGVVSHAERVLATGPGAVLELKTTAATPELAASQWAERHAAHRADDDAESLALLSLALRAPRLAVLAVPPARGSTFELRSAYAEDGTLRARAGVEAVVQQELPAASRDVLRDLLVRGKVVESRPLWRNGWFWAAVGVVAAGAAVTTALLLQRPAERTEVSFGNGQ